MNWDTVLPWRSDEQSNDSTLLGQDLDRCDHDWGEWEEIEEAPTIPLLHDSRTKIEDGYLIFPIYTKHQCFCQKCDQGFLDQRESSKGVIPLSLQMDPDVTIGEAITDPVESDADFAVSEDGETEIVTDTADEGRILVNRSERDTA